MRDFLKLGLALLLALAVGCADDPGDGDGGTSGDGSVGDTDGSTDGSTGDTDGSTGTDSSLPDGSIINADGSPIVRQDGGVVITEDGGMTFTCYVTSCDGHVTECGDCMDNDGDGFVDSRDPECLGPCDNTEGPVLLTGVAGEAGGPCKSDCYFDYGNGSGGGDCEWDHRCDPRSVAPHWDPEGMSCAYEPEPGPSVNCPDEQSESCLSGCLPLTPNGCDCFGCCTFDALAGRSDEDGGEWVWLGSRDDETGDGSCTLDDITDRTACRPCTPVADCTNECGRCELCLGRTELPADCFPPEPMDGGMEDGGTTDGGTPTDGGMPELRCDPGIQACGLPGDDACPPDYYCVTGCCQFVLI